MLFAASPGHTLPAGLISGKGIHADHDAPLSSSDRLGMLVLLATTVWSGPAAPGTPASDSRQRAVTGRYATLLFSRTEITAADGCTVDNRGIARLDTVVAPYLAARDMAGTGTLATDETRQAALRCTHESSSMTASWAHATALARQYGWSFVSHTATYPSSLASLTPEQSEAETCGSAATLDAQGLPGGHGLIAYPGAQPRPVALQTNYASRCFA